jgi:hypothetical protein
MKIIVTVTVTVKPETLEKPEAIKRRKEEQKQ